MSFFSTHIIGREQVPGATSTAAAVAAPRTKSITLTGKSASIILTGKRKLEN